MENVNYKEMLEECVSHYNNFPSQVDAPFEIKEETGSRPEENVIWAEVSLISKNGKHAKAHQELKGDRNGSEKEYSLLIAEAYKYAMLMVLSLGLEYTAKYTVTE